jgi:hypothetical protein
MSGTMGRRPGLWWAAAGVTALLILSFSAPPDAPPDAPSSAQTRTVHNTAALADDHAGHDHDDARRPDKSEPTRNGLRRPGLLDTDLSRPGTAVNGLTSTATQLALAATRQIVQSGLLQVAPGETRDTEVSCPAPFSVVNGGESNDGSVIRLTKNYPVSGSAWHVQVHNDESTARNYRVYADCISGLAQYQRVERLNQDVAPGASGLDHVRCAPGSEIMGGGYSIEATDRFAVSASYPELGSSNNWVVRWRNVGSSPARISRYAVCAVGIQEGLRSKSSPGGPGEYYSAQVTCAAPADQALRAGFGNNNGSDESYIIVTDSYPTANGYVVYGHVSNGASLFALAYCNTVP